MCVNKIITHDYKYPPQIVRGEEQVLVALVPTMVEIMAVAQWKVGAILHVLRDLMEVCILSQVLGFTQVKELQNWEYLI